MCRWQCRWGQVQATQVVRPRPTSLIFRPAAECTLPWTPLRQAPEHSGKMAQKQVSTTSSFIEGGGDDSPELVLTAMRCIQLFQVSLRPVSVITWAK